jgi:hypothetical protein
MKFVRYGDRRGALRKIAMIELDIGFKGGSIS